MNQRLIREGKNREDWGSLPNLVRGWFQQFNERNYLNKDLSNVSMNVWCALVDKLRITFNRADNEIISADFEAKEASAPDEAALSIKDLLISIEERKPRRDPDHELLSQLRDVSPREYGDQKLERFLDAARHLLYEAENVRRWHGNYTWREELDLDAICYPLESLGLVARKLKAAPKPQPGRPSARWHVVGRNIAKDIRSVAKQEGYGSTSYREDFSVTTHVATQAINWAYETDIEPATFAKVMRNKFPRRPRAR
ncbi:hypothetical protein [Methylobacterium sp. J-070]|uniref:hypothetical protein n=1 Tax=Methylobacterium sp. J-070 TaxID=2836650 RepID=UPI001FBAAA41|nr:hypothetical protein [Methylobacterium sp. J-070]MCJ2052003.1 hypothetical protein [Methylobacterium sp. J-070]